MSTRRAGAALLCALLAPSPADGGEVLASRVVHEQGRYAIRIEMQIEADSTAVYRVLTDYAQLSRLNPAITRSELREVGSGERRVFVETHGCVLLFCRKVAMLQRVTEQERRFILVQLDPQGSDFRDGRLVWEVRPADGGSRVIFSGELTPAFWMPPIIGPWALKNKLLEETRQTIQALELYAAP